MFVLAIDINSVDGSHERTIWRFSHDHEKSEDVWFTLAECARAGDVVRDGQERLRILAVQGSSRWFR
jgi:hypothetical protein